MTYELAFSDKFGKETKKLEKKNQITILKKIKTLRNNPSAVPPENSTCRLIFPNIDNDEVFSVTCVWYRSPTFNYALNIRLQLLFSRT